MSKNIVVLSVIIAIVLVVVSFYGGLKYSQGKNPTFDRTSFGQRNPQLGGNNVLGSNRTMGGIVSGEILSIDDKSLTVKSQDGGSRLVFLSASTTISKMASGNIGDLIIGSNISVNGSSNTDNSINAQMIQVRSQIK